MLVDAGTLHLSDSLAVPLAPLWWMQLASLGCLTRFILQTDLKSHPVTHNYQVEYFKHRNNHITSPKLIIGPQHPSLLSSFTLLICYAIRIQPNHLSSKLFSLLNFSLYDYYALIVNLCQMLSQQFIFIYFLFI